MFDVEKALNETKINELNRLVVRSLSKTSVLQYTGIQTLISSKKVKTSITDLYTIINKLSGHFIDIFSHCIESANLVWYEYLTQIIKIKKTFNFDLLYLVFNKLENFLSLLSTKESKIVKSIIFFYFSHTEEDPLFFSRLFNTYKKSANIEFSEYEDIDFVRIVTDGIIGKSDTVKEALIAQDCVKVWTTSDWDIIYQIFLTKEMEYQNLTGESDVTSYIKKEFEQYYNCYKTTEFKNLYEHITNANIKKLLELSPSNIPELTADSIVS
jgi:hypothetical protein